MTLKYENVSFIYDADTNQPVKALDSINLSIGSGEFIGLIGHTGSGKSTLIQHANGLIRPSEGKITADGTDIWSDGYDRKKLRSCVGLVFQYPEHQLFETSILADVCFGPKNLGMSQAEAETVAKEALALVGIDEPLYDVSPFDLSGGQKRRVAIAGVLAMGPDILILDEPTAGLDPGGRRDILKLIRHLHSEKNITVLLVSHSMEDIARYAERILVMDHGRLIADGSVRDIFSERERLRRVGLDIPEALAVIDELRAAGLTGLRDDALPLTAEEAAGEIAAALKKIC